MPKYNPAQEVKRFQASSTPGIVVAFLYEPGRARITRTTSAPYVNSQGGAVVRLDKVPNEVPLWKVALVNNPDGHIVPKRTHEPGDPYPMEDPDLG